MGRKLTTSEWIIKANNIHNYLFDYDKVQYEGSTKKVIITCKIHGDFEQKASSHLEGHGCKQCRIDNKKHNVNDFITKAKLIHNDKFNYSQVVYKNAKSKVEIECPKHGIFEQEANSHLQGKGCPSCKYSNFANVIKHSKEYVIREANKKHNGVYNYNKLKYVNNRTKFCIICKEHGEFWQDYEHHVDRGQGCPSCGGSKGEKLIELWLTDNKIRFKSQYHINVHKVARNSNKVIIDFFVLHNGKQYFIEYDGIQHFEYVPHFHKGGVIDFEKQQRRDSVLNDFCEIHKNKVILIRFDYKQKDDEILNKLNKMYGE